MLRLKTLLDANEKDFVFPSELEPKHEEMAAKIGACYGELLKGEYLIDRKHHNPLSASQLGKPGALLAWNKFQNFEQAPASFAQKRKWLGGHFYELEVMFWLERLGYSYQWQPEIEIVDTIPGHPDFLVEGDSGRFIAECKHVGASNYKAYQKGMYNRSYCTQFALYCTHYQCGGMWVIGNADTGESTYLACDTYTEVIRKYGKYLTDALSKWETITYADSFYDCFSKGITIPLPIQRADGTYGISPELYVSKGVLHPVCALYELEWDEKLRPCVTGYNFPNQIKELEPKWED